MTKIKMIKGLVSNGYDLQPKQVVVRFTTDSIGESLSLEANGMMILVPFEQVQKVIKAARGKDFNKRK